MGKDLVATYITSEFQASVRGVLGDALNGTQTDNYCFLLADRAGRATPPRKRWNRHERHQHPSQLEDPRTRERNVITPLQFPALFRFCSSQCPVLSAQRRVPIDWRPVLEEGNLNSEVSTTTPQNLQRGHSRGLRPLPPTPRKNCRRVVSGDVSEAVLQVALGNVKVGPKLPFPLCPTVRFPGHLTGKFPQVSHSRT